MTPLSSALREALEKATPGPWHETRDGGTGCPQIHTYHEKAPCGSPKPVLTAGPHYRADGLVTGRELPEVRMSDADARAIVLSVNLAPALLAVAEAAEAMYPHARTKELNDALSSLKEASRAGSGKGG